MILSGVVQYQICASRESSSARANGLGHVPALNPVTIWNERGSSLIGEKAIC